MAEGAAIFELMAILLALALVGAIILKVSCILYNLLAGAVSTPSEPLNPLTPGSEPEIVTDSKPPNVPKPSMEWAMCIVFVTGLVNISAGFIITRLLRLAGLATGLNLLRSIPLDLVFFLLAILIQSGINAAMLPTTFGKGLLIALIHLFLSALIVVVLVMVCVFVALVFGLGFSGLGE